MGKKKQKEEQINNPIAKWSSVYNIKQDPKDLNKEKGDVYELLALYSLTPYMSKNQKRGLFRYNIIDYARSIKLFVGDENIFETDSFISLQRKSRFIRWLQKVFNIFDEFGNAIQCKNYSGKVDMENVWHDTSQTGLADIIGSNLKANTRELVIGEEEVEKLGRNYILYNKPVFENIKGAKRERLDELRSIIESGNQLNEQIGETPISINIQEVVDCELEIDGVNYSMIKVKSDKKNVNSDTVYYLYSKNDCFKIIEKTYNVDLGQLTMIKHKWRLMDTYRLINIPSNDARTARQYIELFLNIEQFSYLSTLGLKEKAKYILNDFNGVAVTMDELISSIRDGKFFDNYQKFEYDDNFGFGARPRITLEGKLGLKLKDAEEKGKITKNKAKRAVKRFIERKPIFN